MTVVYLDASAAAKLVLREQHSTALRAWLAGRPIRVSSRVIRTELLRAVRRAEPLRLDRARRVLSRLTLLELDEAILDSAVLLDPVELRSLDAIHIETARRLGAELEALVTYDRRMIDGATRLGLPVASPA
ncbi:MAG TPA: type II toxin-antitoxin system VapC family toxin [Candidatus Limnocylindrales bacterium]|nr:type II toxin-antitoxin system VapC family toxin [Candidatus Limnocylindrales bacterium]